MQNNGNNEHALLTTVRFVKPMRLCVLCLNFSMVVIILWLLYGHYTTVVVALWLLYYCQCNAIRRVTCTTQLNGCLDSDEIIFNVNISDFVNHVMEIINAIMESIPET